MTEDSPRLRDPDHLQRALRRWQRAGAFAGLLLLLAFPVYLATEEARRDEALAAREANLASMGRELWIQNCASCHGLNGEGVDAPALNAQQFLLSATDDQIHHLTAAGLPGTEMPAWWIQFGGPLTDEQIQALVVFVRSWKETAPDRPDWRSPMPPEAPPHENDQEEEEEAEEPEEEVPDRETVRLVATDRGCEPLEIEVRAGRRFTLVVVNESGQSISVDVAALGEHAHAEPGQRLRLALRADDPGEYPFECLGAAHGTVLGAGVIRAT